MTDSKRKFSSELSDEENRPKKVSKSEEEKSISSRQRKEHKGKGGELENMVQEIRIQYNK